MTNLEFEVWNLEFQNSCLKAGLIITSGLTTQMFFEIAKEVFEKVFEPPEMRRERVEKMKKEQEKKKEFDPLREIVAEKASEKIAAKLPVPGEVREIAKTGLRAGIKKLWKLFKKRKTENG